MLRFIFTKIKNKYKLYIALLVGVIVMIAVFGVVMLLRKGSLDRLIQSEFVESYKDTGQSDRTVRTMRLPGTGI